MVSDLHSGGAVEGVADHALAGREVLLLRHQRLKLGRYLLLLGVLQGLQKRLETRLPRGLLAQARGLRIASGIGFFQRLRGPVQVLQLRSLALSVSAPQETGYALPQAGPCVGAGGLNDGGTARSGHGHECFGEHAPVLRVRER
ncbi:hypothetical protein ACIRL0_24380 [Streptomyces sp. NPDC102365]|uniref:hypothetical protein n=1 Tax=Streptomyces sp. NPDC102365 TaxID=3366162 RepID=UPI00381533EA